MPRQKDPVTAEGIAARLVRTHVSVTIHLPIEVHRHLALESFAKTGVAGGRGVKGYGIKGLAEKIVIDHVHGEMEDAEKKAERRKKRRKWVTAKKQDELPLEEWADNPKP